MTCCTNPTHPYGRCPWSNEKEIAMTHTQSIGGTSRIIWRAVFVQAIAWCLGVSQHVIIRGAR